LIVGEEGNSDYYISLCFN